MTAFVWLVGAFRESKGLWNKLPKLLKENHSKTLTLSLR